MASKRPLTEKELLDIIENGSDIEISDDEDQENIDNAVKKPKERICDEEDELEVEELEDPYATDEDSDNSFEAYYTKSSISSTGIRYSPRVLRSHRQSLVLPSTSQESDQQRPSTSHASTSAEYGNRPLSPAMSTTSETSSIDERAVFSTRVLRSTAAMSAESQRPRDNRMGVEENIEPQYKYTDKKSVEWRHVRNTVTFDSSPAIEYSPHPVQTVQTAFNYFNQYLKPEFYEKAAFYTNLYATQNNTRHYMPTDAHEIQQLFGLHGMHSILNYPRVRMHWENATATALFTQNMTRDRFFQLRTHLHLVDNTAKAPDNVDKFYKVRPIMDAVREKLLEEPLETNLCIDEQMIPFKGKLETKQYVKGKPTPWGLKVFVLCGKSGRPFDFIMYQGSTTEMDNELLKKIGFGTAIVMKLVERIPEHATGHRLFFDNFFSSYQLFELLLQRKIFAAGTVRTNRFSKPPLPSDQEMQNRGRGTSAEVISRDGKIILTKWFDNKAVNLGSNFVGIGNVDKVKRYNKTTKQYIEINRPEVVKAYNESMGGVDSLDQMVQYYRIFIRSRKWALRVIFHFFDVAVVSAWHEYRRDCIANEVAAKNQMDLLAFKVELSRTLVLLKTTSIPRRVGRPCFSPEEMPPPDKRRRIAPPKDIRYDQTGHLPMFSDDKNNSRCGNERCTAKTFIFCVKCNVFLCIKRESNCFYKYHVKQP